MRRENKLYETEDGPIYHSRSVAVVHLIMVVSTHDPRILLTKRSMLMADEPGKWCIPCGYLDWDETVEEAAKREIKEETGVDLESFTDDQKITDTLLVGINSSPKSNRQNVSMRYLTILDVEELPGTTLNPEVSEIMWVSPNQLHLLKEGFAFNHQVVIQEMLDVAKSIFEIL
jgi:8-oxo-dGTP pyrophosphatase MutT (NUDIX family)